MTHTPTAPLSDLPRIIRENLENCRKHDVANATLVLSREMLEELDGLIGRDGGAVSQDAKAEARIRDEMLADYARIYKYPTPAETVDAFNKYYEDFSAVSVLDRMSNAELEKWFRDRGEDPDEIVQHHKSMIAGIFAAIPTPTQLPQPMEWQSAVGDGRMNNDWQLYVDGSLRRWMENRLAILERRIVELEKT